MERTHISTSPTGAVLLPITAPLCGSSTGTSALAEGFHHTFAKAVVVVAQSLLMRFVCADTSRMSLK